MFLRKRGVIELPLVVLVIILLNLALFGLGTYLLFLLYTESTELYQEAGALNKAAAPELEKPLPEERVALSASLLVEKGRKEVADCSKDLSCEAYFIFVPLNEWPDEKLFTIKARERGKFFREISQFKFKKTGILTIPFSFAPSCNLKNINKEQPWDHLRIKKCADAYADSVGIQYTRAVGLSSTFDGGKAYFKGKALYASRGYQKDQEQSERPGIVAHEIGHTYNLCDEYSFKTYQAQNRYFVNHPCKNAFPATCSAVDDQCLGNTPVFRAYAGESLSGVCSKKKQYSVMGFSIGVECGYDATGGYDAIH